MSDQCPLLPRKRTWIITVPTSAFCQKQTLPASNGVFRAPGTARSPQILGYDVLRDDAAAGADD